MNGEQRIFRGQRASQKILYELIPLNIVVDVWFLGDDILDEGIVALFVATTHLDCSHFEPECPFAAHACVNFIHKFRADFSSLCVDILS